MNAHIFFNAGVSRSIASEKTFSQYASRVTKSSKLKDSPVTIFVWTFVGGAKAELHTKRGSDAFNLALDLDRRLNA